MSKKKQETMTAAQTKARWSQIFYRLPIIALLGSVIGVFPVSLPASPPNDLEAGPTFSDPKIQAPMPKSWHQKKISYEKTDKGSDLVVSLGQQTYPALHKVIEKFAAEKQVRITLKKGTCGISAGRLVRKTVDVGGFCCPPGETDRLPGLTYHTIAIAPIALIAHPDNPVSNITVEEARQIFQGKLRQWDKVKHTASHKPLQSLTKPAARLHCKIRPGHWRGLLDRENLFTPRLYEVGVIPDMISYVAKTRGALGYETELMVQEHAKSGKVKILSVNGHHPNELKHVLSGQYPMYRVYNLATWENNDAQKKRLAMELISYVRSYIKKNDRDYGMVCTSKLKKAGWRFQGGELIGEPRL